MLLLADNHLIKISDRNIRFSRRNLLGKKMGHSKLWQGLPCLYEAHLGLNEAHLGHILMSFQNTGGNLRIMHM